MEENKRDVFNEDINEVNIMYDSSSSLEDIDEDDTVVDIEALYAVSSGVDDYSAPNSALSLSVSDLKTQSVVDKVDLEEVYVNLMGTGGCAVAELVFPLYKSEIWEKAQKLCFDWIDKTDEEGLSNEFFSLIVLPLVLGSGVFIVFTSPVYADAYETENNYILAISLDNTKTFLSKGDEIAMSDLNEILKTESMNEQIKIDNEILELENEYNNLKKQINPMSMKDEFDYADIDITDTLNPIDTDNDNYRNSESFTSVRKSNNPENNSKTREYETRSELDTLYSDLTENDEENENDKKNYDVFR